MTWSVTAQTFRCRGKIGTGIKGPIRCRTIVCCGTWFWANGKRPLCAACAVDSEQHAPLTDEDLEERRNLLDHRHGKGPRFTDQLIERSAST